MKVNRWGIARRSVQLAALGLFLAPAFGLRFFEGNLQSALLFGLPLSDPLAGLQVLLLTGSLAGTLLLGMALVALGYYLTGGRSFCGWICPVGLLTDLAEKLPGQGRLPRWPLGWKWWALGLALVLSLLLGIPVFETVSPIGIVSRAPSLGGIDLLLVPGLILLAELLLARRLWCRSLCPLGGFYALLGRLSPLRVGFLRSRCRGCGCCRRVCVVPEVLAPSLDRGVAQVRSGDCTRCGACIDSCPDAALTFQFRHPFHSGGST